MPLGDELDDTSPELQATWNRMHEQSNRRTLAALDAILDTVQGIDESSLECAVTLQGIAQRLRRTAEDLSLELPPCPSERRF